MACGVNAINNFGQTGQQRRKKQMHPKGRHQYNTREAMKTKRADMTQKRQTIPTSPTPRQNRSNYVSVAGIQASKGAL